MLIIYWYSQLATSVTTNAKRNDENDKLLNENNHNFKFNDTSPVHYSPRGKITVIAVAKIIRRGHSACDGAVLNNFIHHGDL